MERCSYVPAVADQDHPQDILHRQLHLELRKPGISRRYIVAPLVLLFS
jgi:hypothetical protein